jgi:hypothetical protein
MFSVLDKGNITCDYNIYKVVLYNLTYVFLGGALGSVVIKALCYKPEGRGFDTRWGDFFKIYLILPAALDSGVHSASNRNEYQKH